MYNYLEGWLVSNTVLRDELIAAIVEQEWILDVLWFKQ